MRQLRQVGGISIRPDYLHNPHPCRKLGCPLFGTRRSGLMNSSLDKVASSPGQAYDYINSNYGLPGLIVAGVLIVVAIVGIMIALDRRK